MLSIKYMNSGHHMHTALFHVTNANKMELPVMTDSAVTGTAVLSNSQLERLATSLWVYTTARPLGRKTRDLVIAVDAISTSVQGRTVGLQRSKSTQRSFSREECAVRRTTTTE